ncbi:hypothetical protein KY363_03145 [Candidatus Woesearchaeota archaeon]|nr:hypothetical protein [Candidatus Woesearchaeota archaeon]
MGKSGAIHPEYNLDTLLETTLKAKLPAREQLRLMNAVLEHIAQIDPRIKGEEGAPQASISRVGGRVYDLQFMQQMYSYVQKELAERQK